MKAAYDEIADWYAEEVLGAGDPLGIEGVLRGLLGRVRAVRAREAQP